MIRGLYTSASGMLKQQKKIDVVSNNLANASTTGYKKDIAVSQEFRETLIKKINDIEEGQLSSNAGIGKMSFGSDIIQIYTDYTQGRLVKTDVPTDISIKNSNSAFFVINIPTQDGNQEMYSRHGSWTIRKDGYLVTKEGYEVLGSDGPIYLTTDDFIVQEDGSIYINDEYIDTLKIVDFVNIDELFKYGENLIQAPEGAEVRTFNGQVAQGFVEGSNVNTIQEMVDMIALMRSYEANQKVIRTYDESLGKVINEVGKV